MFRKRICGRLLTVAVSTALVAGCVPNSEKGWVPKKRPVLERDTGFWEIVPPSTLNYLPGTITTVEFTEDRKVKLHPTCKIDADDIRDKINPANKTTDNFWDDFNNSEGDILAALEKIIFTEFGIEQVKTESISFQNTQVYVADDETVLEIREKYLTGKCQDAVEAHIASGKKVCQTRAVMQGDIKFELASRDDLSTKIQGQETVEELPGFRVAMSEANRRKVSGQNVYFGVKLFPYGIIMKDAKKVECKPDSV